MDNALDNMRNSEFFWWEYILYAPAIIIMLIMCLIILVVCIPVAAIREIIKYKTKKGGVEDGLPQSF